MSLPMRPFEFGGAFWRSETIRMSERRRRQELIGYRATAAEKITVERAADERGLSVAAFVRQAVLDRIQEDRNRSLT